MKQQRYPFGYLSLLDAKAQGDTPYEVDDRITPSLEMYPFELAAISLTTSAVSNAGISAVGQSAALIVPNSEAWVLAGLMGQITALTAAVVASFSVSITPPDGQPSCAVATLAPRAAVGATELLQVCWTPPAENFIVGPGTRFDAALSAALSSGTGTMTMRALYRKLLV